MQVISDFNLYCDSQDIQSGKGDDFRLNLGSAGIQAGDGQYIKLSLQSFNMYKNFYNVNDNNNAFTVFGVRTSGSVAWTADTAITRKNYKTIGDLATQFASDVATQIATTNSTTCVVSAVSPDPTLQMDDTSDRIIRFTLTTGISLNSLGITCYRGDDTYALLGVDEIDVGIQASSFTITGSGTSWTVTGKYPAQRSTEEHAYLRCDSVNNNLEMSGLSLGVMPNNTSSILSSDILAKIPIDFEYINFNTGTGNEFIMNLPNKSVNSLHFYLTDSKGRPLGRKIGSETNSAVSPTATQTTTGNVYMSFVVKVEIIQAYRPNKLISEPPPQNPIFFKKQGVMNNMNFGAGNY
jgi:hypothetical protein